LVAFDKYNLPTSSGRLPVHFGIILFPGFQALDVFGPLDALNTLAKNHAIYLHVIAETLSPVSTEPPAGLPSSKTGSFNQSVLPTHTFDTAPKLDVLIVPGGFGTRHPSIQSSIDFVAKVYPSLQYLITVCTGSGIAGRAGVLNGKRATTNKRSFVPTTESTKNQVKWVSHARWVVDGNIWTSAGVSAGLDVIFAWIGEVYGKETAAELANVLEYDRHTDSSWDPFADLYNLKDDEWKPLK